MTVTVQLAPVPVRYSYRQPSLSRRGGVRLHPLKDGVARMGEELTWLRTRDKSGQKLQDIIDPVTGWCRGVRSPLECEPHNIVGEPVKPGTSGSHNVETRRAAVQFNETHGVWVDEEGYVIRTCDMGDGLRPVARVKPRTEPQKERGVGKTTGRTTQPGSDVPGATGRNGGITKSDCEAVVRAMAQGRNVKITKDMLKNARKLLEQRRKEAAKVLRIK